MTEFNHHGIEGQKWGVRNGPPYPLDRMVSTGRALKSTLKARHEAHVAEKHKKLAAKIISTNQKIEYYEAKNKLQNQKLLYREGKSKQFFMLPTGETVMDRNARKRAQYEKDRDFSLRAQQQKASKNTIGSTVKKTLLDVGSSLAKDAINNVAKPYITKFTTSQADKDLASAKYDAELAKAKYQAKNPGGKDSKDNKEGDN